MPDRSGRNKRSLRERSGGPNAQPVRTLISRADASAALLYGQYGEFARQRLVPLEKLLASLEEDAVAPRWQAMAAAVKDLRSSSANCEAKVVCDIARSWEKTFAPELRGNAKIFSVMRIHLNTLKLVLGHGLGAAELATLQSRLVQMVGALHQDAPL